MWVIWLIFCDCGFQSVCPLMDKDKRLMKFSWCERLKGKLGLVLMGGAMFSKSLIQFSVDGWALFPPCCLTWGQTIGGNEDNGDLLQKVPCLHCYTQCPQPCSRPLPTHASLEAKLWPRPRQLIKKQRHYFDNKGSSSQIYGFSSSHIWMWELD